MPVIRPLRFASIAAVLLVPVLAAQVQVPTASDPARYVLPPKNVVDAFDAESLPQTLLSPNHRVVAIMKARPYPTIAELAQPMLRLAGARVNARTNGPHRDSGLPGTGISSIVLKKIGETVESYWSRRHRTQPAHCLRGPSAHKPLRILEEIGKVVQD